MRPCKVFGNLRQFWECIWQLRERERGPKEGESVRSEFSSFSLSSVSGAISFMPGMSTPFVVWAEGYFKSVKKGLIKFGPYVGYG